MPRTFISQPTQIFSSEVFRDDLTPGNIMTASLNLENDLNNIRTQIRQILWANVSGSWYDIISAPSGSNSARGLNTLNSDLTNLEQKRLLFRNVNFNTVIVHSSSNFALLSASNGTAPSDFIALSSTNQTGSLVASLLAAQYGSHSMEFNSGTILARPKNLCLVRDSFTGNIIQDTVNSNKDVFALLQIQNGATNGGSFNDSTHKTQLSFVVENPSGSLIPASIAAIGGKHILYSYSKRTALDDIPEDAYISDTSFVDILLSSAVSGSSLTRSRFTAGVTTDVTANTNITFGSNLDNQLGNYSSKSFTNDVNVFLNGILMLPGSPGNTNDVYPGTSQATGDLKFPYNIRSGTQLSMEIF